MGLLEYRLSVVFNEKKTVTSWVPSVASGMALCAGNFFCLFEKKQKHILTELLNRPICIAFGEKIRLPFCDNRWCGIGCS